MAKKSSVSVPPLSFETLNLVGKLENYASNECRKCVGPWSFNREKAIRILRTCIHESVVAQINYYVTLPNYQPEWVAVVKSASIESTMGLVPDENRYSEIKDELERTLKALEAPQKAQSRKKPHANSGESIGVQLNKFLDEGRLTIEQLAEGIKVTPRSVYRHLSGEATPRRSQIISYEAFLTKKLKREVRLKTSV